MMRIGTKLLTMLAVVALAGAMEAMPLSAHASDGDLDFFVYVSCTTSLSPAMQLVGGSGTYAESSNCGVGLCVSTDTVPPEVFTCSRQEEGQYSSTVCGTGVWSGTETTTEPDGGTDSASYQRTFVSGLGVETGGDAAVLQLVLTSPATPPACANGFEVVIVGTSS